MFVLYVVVYFFQHFSFDRSFILWLYHILFIIDKHLGCFHILSGVSSAMGSTCVQVCFLEDQFSVILVYSWK